MALHDDQTSPELVLRHRELNKKTGSKGHRLTREEKHEKFLLKKALVARTKHNDSDAVKYAIERSWHKATAAAE